MSNIDAIIFDLGGVILNLDTDKTIRSFEAKCPGFPKERFNGAKDQHQIFSDYERGEISSEAFYKSFLSLYEINLPYESFCESWNAMLLDLPVARIELLDRLGAQGKKIFLLSNTNEIHAEAFEKTYDALRLGGHFKDHFDRAYYSFQMRLRKPDPEIFKSVLNSHNLTPETTLFIDDSIQHVETAKALGLHTIHLVKPQTIDTLSL